MARIDSLLVLQGKSYLPDLPIHLMERALPAAILDHTFRNGPTLGMLVCIPGPCRATLPGMK